MKAPKEIYLPLVDWGEDGEIMPGPVWLEESDASEEKENIKGAVKYIRADLTELTWEDIEKIVDLYEDVYSDYSCNGNGGITNTNEHYQEILRRFLESKK